MPRKIINVGVVANDGTGDSLRTASNKANDNFAELYTTIDGMTAYNLPIASAVTLGGVKVGSGLSVNGSGVLSASIVNELTDLGIADGSNGQVLTTDGQGNFTFQTPSAATNLNALTDVTITAPLQVNQVIKYNGTQWVNGTGSAGATNLDGLTDVTINTPTNGQVLKYNGTEWVNGTDNNTGNPFDQSLNTTNNVQFQSAKAADFVLSGSGTPTVQSDTDINLLAGNRVAVVSKTPFKFPSLTTAERDGITAQNGDVIYNSSLNKLQVYAASTWVNLH
jgi:hypothetical protein